MNEKQSFRVLSCNEVDALHDAHNRNMSSLFEGERWPAEEERCAQWILAMSVYELIAELRAEGGRIYSTDSFFYRPSADLAEVESYVFCVDAGAPRVIRLPDFPVGDFAAALAGK